HDNRLRRPSRSFQVAIVWAFGLTVAIILTEPLRGAHLNLAIKIAMVVFRAFPKRQAIAYILVQFLGAFAAPSPFFKPSRLGEISPSP
ncbi:MAG: aquaporin, partial [Verrucomicrobiia bacterium]